MSTTSWHDLYGMRVRSEIPLDAAQSAAGDTPPDLDIVLGAKRAIFDEQPDGVVVGETARRDDPTRPFYTAFSGTSGHLLRIYGCCDLYVTPALDRMECRLKPGADPDLVAVYLGGIGSAFVLGLGGHPVLHAAAVVAPLLEGEMIVIAGGAGSGKSTVTALLCAAGCGFVTDDLLRLAFSERAALVIGGGTRLRLRPASVQLLDAFAQPPKIHPTGDGRIALEISNDFDGPASVRAILVPWPDRDGSAVRIDPIAPSDALLALARFPRLEGWMSPTVQAMQFDALARLVGCTPVYFARIPWNPTPDLSAAVELLRHLVD